MKKDVLLKVFTLVVASCLISCSNDNQKIQEGDNSVNIKSYSSQIEEAKALALPVDEINSIPNNIKDKRAAAVILSNYVSIKDSLYSLDISKEEAQKIGIDADLYISILEDLNNSNRAIKEARLQGKKISLPNVKEEYKEYRQSLQVQQALRVQEITEETSMGQFRQCICFDAKPVVSIVVLIICLALQISSKE